MWLTTTTGDRPISARQTAARKSLRTFTSKSYHKLGLSELEERSREIMADNFPNNSYASKSAFR